MFIYLNEKVSQKDKDLFEEQMIKVETYIKNSEIKNFDLVLNSDIYIGKRTDIFENFGILPDKRAIASYWNSKKIITYHTDIVYKEGPLFSVLIHEFAHKLHNEFIKDGYENKDIKNLYRTKNKHCQLPEIGDSLALLREDSWSVKLSSLNDYILTDIVFGTVNKKPMNVYIYKNSLEDSKLIPESSILEKMTCPSDYGSQDVKEWFAEMCTMITLKVTKSSQEDLKNKLLAIIKYNS